MKYLITYRLRHSDYFPSTHTSELEAYTHAELEEQLAKILSKWRAAGYTVYVLRIQPERKKRLS